MPELPEVETTRRGIEKHIVHQKITAIVVRNKQLRWPVAVKDLNSLIGKEIFSLTRRGKYLIFDTGEAGFIVHLGMSGRLRIMKTLSHPQKHDHWDISFSNGYILRYNDTRRFGALLYAKGDPLQHECVERLGIEPFDKECTAAYLFAKAVKRNTTIKQFLLDHTVIAGIGNIYASECLFYAGISPFCKVSQLTKDDFQKIADNAKIVLKKAIKAGGTTLKDFLSSDGKPGYFSQQLMVYGRENLPCLNCGTLICCLQLGQRSTFYCPNCQA
jgi:formamidopyrimidine-DNA glycosylase